MTVRSHAIDDWLLTSSGSKLREVHSHKGFISGKTLHRHLDAVTNFSYWSGCILSEGFCELNFREAFFHAVSHGESGRPDDMKRP